MMSEVRNLEQQQQRQQQQQHQGPVLKGDFASEQDSNEQLARTMAVMSQEERARILEDVHGVSDDINETQEMIAQSLASFEAELNQLQYLNAALRMAIAKDHAYVQNQAFRLQFLRAESFDIKAAVQRFARHFKMKLQLFGEEKLTKDIVQDDLDEDTMEYLYSGRFQNLPLRDKSGRHVSLYMMKLAPTFTANSDVSVMKRVYYNAMINAESVETQKKGVVVVVWGIGGKNTTTRRLSASTFWKVAEVQKSLPLKVVAFHFCYDNMLLRPVLSTIQMGCGFFTGVRFRAHYGTHLDCTTALQSFGIPANLIPINSEGTVTSNEYHVAQMKKRRIQERQELRTTRTVMIPCSFDILVGKGKPFQEHPGNMELREWIRKHQTSYEVAQKYEKKNLVLQVIGMVKGRGGRFLKDVGGCWSEVEEDVARAKVGHLFRDKKRTRDPKVAAAIKTNRAFAMSAMKFK
ncbi:unnamed protein product [Cylindrotheca closterium]|uniref:DUF6824 domain-containing protein n=1 Tax=Cylindrotheca closterium TaxID=2856 RepID=A0AAD2JKL2_9STRA|nr:unnamed protein product [Cylindrotheca closterium]